MEPKFIDAETVHNWTQRYHSLPFFADLSHAARDAMLAAFRAHHNDGLNAREAADDLAARFPAEFKRTL